MLVGMGRLWFGARATEVLGMGLTVCGRACCSWKYCCTQMEAEMHHATEAGASTARDFKTTTSVQRNWHALEHITRAAALITTLFNGEVSRPFV